MTSSEKIAGIGSDAVKKATGKSWARWLAVLDKKKATEMTHKEIAEFLHEKKGLSGWWSQMVTVGYEQARGMRKAHQQSTGFEMSKSRTLPISPMKAFKAWEDNQAREQWLGERIVIRKATRGKSMRVTWPDKTHVDVNFYGKGKNKCQVSVQHTKLPNSTKCERMKKYWGEKLEAYKEYLGL
jgi:hypothetical protein